MALDNIKRWGKRKILNIGKELVEYMKRPDTRWLGGFCAEQGFHRQRLPEFAREYPQFDRYYKQAKQLQENKLIELVIENNTNAGFVTFLLKNISRDLTDKQNLELSGEVQQRISQGEIASMTKEELREFLRSNLSK